MRVATFGALLLGVATTGCLYEGPASPMVVHDEPVYVAPAQPPPAYAPPPAEVAPPQAPPPQMQAEVDEAAPPAPAGTDVGSEEAFVEPLSGYGNWTIVAGYGRVWVPAVAYGWRPYYYGHWELTEWGWTFVSTDPWGWAAYHYGRWNWGMGVGWYWIPGRVWGPAWVSWRYGGGYVTWCPMGPRGVVFGYGHPGWVVVGEAHFTQPIARVAIVGRPAAGIIRTAQPLSGRYAVVARGGAFGPPVNNISRATGHVVTAVPANRAIAVAHAQAVAPRAGGVNRSPVRSFQRSPGPAGNARPGAPQRSFAQPGRPGAVSRPGGGRAQGNGRSGGGHGEHK
jgi:hypothetical protein